MLNYLFAKSLLMQIIFIFRKKDEFGNAILLNPKNPSICKIGLIKVVAIGNFDKDLGKQRSNATKYIEKSLELELYFILENFTKLLVISKSYKIV